MHAITRARSAACSTRHGYGEIHTPALEYEQVLARGDPAAAEPAYKLFDEQGNVLVLRSDMTIPIARVVATRYATREPPLRFCYVAHAYRSVRPQRGQDARDAAGGRRARRRARAGGHGRGADACSARALDAVGLRGLPDRARRRLALPRAARRPRRAGGGARRRSCTSSTRATSSASSGRSAACGSGPRRPRAARRAAAARRAGGARRGVGAGRRRGCARVVERLLAPRSPSG